MKTEPLFRSVALVSALCLTAALVASQDKQAKPEDTEFWTPVPPVVTPGEGTAAPSDATVLLGKDGLGAWTNNKGEASKWDFADGIATVKQGAGDLVSKQSFGSCQVHIEWRTPSVVKGDGQGRGNSGMFFMGQYELQIMDSFNNPTYVNGQAGSVYKQYAPLVNASRKPGVWQTYDAVFEAPVFNADKTLKRPAYITALHNGVLVQNHVEVHGETVWRGKATYKPHAAKLPFQLQNHGNPVSFRNMWVRELDSK